MVEIIPTEKMKNQHKVLQKVREALQYFPEFDGKRLIVGHDQYHPGSASLSDFIISLSKRPKYFTIGHELFLDLEPSYLQWDDKIDWETHKLDIHRICIEGIKLRQENRKYIYWIRKEIEKLST